MIKIDFFIFTMRFNRHGIFNGLNINQAKDFLNIFYCNLIINSDKLQYDYDKIIEMDNEIINRLEYFISK